MLPPMWLSSVKDTTIIHQIIVFSLLVIHSYITSDCDAVSVIYTNQNYTKTPEDAVAITLKAGIQCNH